MAENMSVKEIASKVEELHRIADTLYKGSEDFPAVNRNVKRILASIEMLRVNVETSAD